ncbi:MAG: hypothetical protein H8E76_00035 [Helicobacteraceae bacterium]|nr:hypothetical protein [Candidatus Sulfurimonas ponti]
MNITVLIIVFIFLVLLLAVLIIFLFKSAKNKNVKSEKTAEIKPKVITLDKLRDRLKDKNLSKQDLENTLNSVIKDYGVIENLDIYVDIIFRMTNHPSTTKEIILSFEKDLSKLNPKYASSISDNVIDGLSLR